jgi:hypothetical protein
MDGEMDGRFPPLRGFLLTLGILLVAAAILWPFLSRWIGRFPGDVVVRRENFTFAFPIVTCLLISLVLSLLLWLFRR